MSKDADILDSSKLSRLVDGNMRSTVLGELIDLFVEDGAQKIAQARAAARNGDAAGVRAIAHRFAGSASMMGARRLHQVASRGEARLAAGNANLPAVVHQLDCAFSDARQALRAFLDSRPSF